MKSSVAITLILAGVLVVAVPALWSGWDALMVAMTLTHLSQPGSSINFAEVPPPYQFGCWALGAGMIAVAVVASMTAERRSGRAVAAAGTA